jgi:hypothetical protein
VLNCFHDGEKGALKILHILQEHYEKEAVSGRHKYYWVREIAQNSATHRARGGRLIKERVLPFCARYGQSRIHRRTGLQST